MLHQLSDLQKFVLSQIAEQMHRSREFCLHDLVKNAIMHKDVSSFPDELVAETSYAIAAFLDERELLCERKERRIFRVTEKGNDQLKREKIQAIMK